MIDHYLTSSRFNGFHVGSDSEIDRASEALVLEGLVEVITEQDFPNPHIRPWHTRRSKAEQVEALRAALAGETYGACLYPMPKALAEHPRLQEFADAPYRARMARGAGALDLAYFRMDALETYRNDPRFSFQFDDFGARTVVSDAVYLDEAEPDDDKIHLRLGFAYRFPSDADANIVRYACVFVDDLARLSPAHQRRWETYEVRAEGLQPHPVWWGIQMGHWPDGMGPFRRFLYELKTWNELHERAFGVALLRTTERPRELGWLLRPSQREFDEFVQTLDKLLSENLRHKAFDALGIPRKGAEGQNYGTLARLDLVLADVTGASADDRQDVLAPLREVRKARQEPAHAIRANISDANFIRRQAELLRDVTGSVYALRELWAGHPANVEWSEPHHIKDTPHYWL